MGCSIPRIPALVGALQGFRLGTLLAAGAAG